MWHIIDTLRNEVVASYEHFAYAYKECSSLNARFYVEVGDSAWYMRYTLKHIEE
jgi:hypothetical protein